MDRLKKYPPKVDYLPLGIQPETVLGLSGILENKVAEYMIEFPKRIKLKPASINNGAITFKFFEVRRERK